MNSGRNLHRKVEGGWENRKYVLMVAKLLDKLV